MYTLTDIRRRTSLVGDVVGMWSWEPSTRRGQTDAVNEDSSRSVLGRRKNWEAVFALKGLFRPRTGLAT